MKKLSLLLVTTLLLSACSWFGGGTDMNGNKNVGPQLVSKTGIIRSKNISFDTPGTHQLQQPDGTVLFLESKTLALSTYLDQTVTVEGILRQENNTNVLDVNNVVLTALNENDNSSPVSLLQYTGNLGVSFNYSSFFTITDSTDTKVAISLADQTLRVDNKEEPVITLEIVAGDTKDLKGWIKTTLKQDSVTVQVGNAIGERLVNRETNDATIYVWAKRLYKIDFLAPGGKDENLVKNKFYEMLDSFNWSGSANTNGSQTVSNQNANTSSTNQNSSVSAANRNANVFYTGEVSTTPTDDLKNRVIAYVKENLNDLKPTDEAVTGTVQATRFEFASPNYVYVEYSDGTNKRKLLLKYYEEAGAIKVSQVAYFVPGESQDWVIKTGSNEAAKASREIYDAGGNKTADVNEGMRLYENKTLKYGVQYPASWYYAGSTPSASGAIHQVSFSDKPLDGSEAKITVTVFKDTLADLGISSTATQEGGNVVFYVEKDGRVYKVVGPQELSTTVQQMSQSVVTY